MHQTFLHIGFIQNDQMRLFDSPGLRWLCKHLLLAERFFIFLKVLVSLFRGVLGAVFLKGLFVYILVLLFLQLLRLFGLIFFIFQLLLISFFFIFLLQHFFKQVFLLVFSWLLLLFIFFQQQLWLLVFLFQWAYLQFF